MKRYIPQWIANEFVEYPDGEWVKWDDAEPYVAVIETLAELGNPEYIYYPTWLSRLIHKAKELSGEDK